MRKISDTKLLELSSTFAQYSPGWISWLQLCGIISHSEERLLSTVFYYSARGKCWISDKNLACRIGCSTGTARNLITNCKRLKLLRVRIFKGKRYLDVSKSNCLKLIRENWSKAIEICDVLLPDLDMIRDKQNHENENSFSRFREKVTRKASGKTSAIARAKHKKRVSRIYNMNGSDPKGSSPDDVGRDQRPGRYAFDDWGFSTNGHTKHHVNGSTKLLDVGSDEYDAHDEKLAHQLHSTLLGLNRLRSDKRNCTFTKTKSTWAKQIHQLIDRHGKKTVTELIRWYSNNARDKYTPIVWSVTSLKTKFKQIQAAMKRHETKNPKVKISRDAKSIVKRLKNFRWPRGSEQQLPTAVQLSLQNYESFRNGVSDTKMGSRDKTLARYIVQQLHRPNEFVYQWFEDVFWRRESWDGWDGNLMRDVFTPDNDQFIRQCKTLTGQYCNRPQRWNAVLEKLNAN